MRKAAGGTLIQVKARSSRRTYGSLPPGTGFYHARYAAPVIRPRSDPTDYHRRGPEPQPPRPSSAILAHDGVGGGGALLAVAAVAIRTWGAAYLKSEVVHDLDLHNEALIADGPYRWTRNPLYVGGVLLGAGIGFMASRLGWLVLVILIYVFYMRLIGREELELRKTQGASYAAYCERVPRFWPALAPRVPSGGMKPRWKQAFAGESFVWAFAMAMAVFAATLNQQLTYKIMGAALLAYAVYVFGLRRRRRAQTADPH